MRNLAKYSIFILLPVLLAALLFLGRLNLQAAQNIGEWGERSIVQSTYILAKEKVDRVEDEIISFDNKFFGLLQPGHLDAACEKWTLDPNTTMVQAAVIYNTNNDIVEFFHKETRPKAQRALYQLVKEQIIPQTNLFDSLEQHKHYHWEVDGKYYLISTYTTEFHNEVFTRLLLYDTDEITGFMFDRLLGQVGKNRVLNVVDNTGRIIFGDAVEEPAEFSVSGRFPSTLYKWRIQITPLSTLAYTRKQQQAKISNKLFVPVAFGIVVFSIFVLVLVWIRERRLNTLKSEFISNTSHELKTPLALIKMFTELLVMQKNTSPEKRLHYQQIILKETDRLTSLIDNVLDFAKLEKGKSVYHFELLNPCETARDIIDIYSHRVEKSGAKLVFDCPPDIPLVFADKDAFTLVLLNFIDNAVKYAEGTDIIAVHIHATARYLYLDVIDRGPGIPASQLKRIFDRFYRYRQDKTSSKQRGSGIGLSLVKSIAKAHRGNVTVSSRPHVETRFSVSFPIKKQH